MSELDSLLKKNLDNIKERIDKAARKSGRKMDDIKMVAVTKTVKPERIMEALQLGIVDFGENRVQELCEKYDIIDKRYRWHLIGHLQTNKVKHIIGRVHMIHSLDRMDLAREIQKRAERAGVVVDALVQVNIAREETKFGVLEENAKDFIRQLSSLKNIKVKGLMTIAPYVDNPEEVRHVFRRLRNLLIDIKEENIDNIDMDYLSMGMSNDYEVAIEEGSNIVRIGTALFGERH